MTILDAIYERTTSEIGDLIGVQCYPYQLPRDIAFPAVTFFRVDDIDDYPTHDKVYTLINSRFQFNTYAKTVTDLDQLTSRLIRAWVGFQGTVAGVQIKNSQKLTRGNAFRSSDFKDEDLNVFFESVDFSLIYDRSY